MRPPDEKITRAAILVLFFLSGACGLVYEVVWMRMLTLVFGATAYATAAILAAFFSGLALGSLLFGRLADRVRRPLHLYAALEAGVGALAFLMPVLLEGVTWAYVTVASSSGLGYHGLVGLRLVLSFGVLVVPAILMGGTLPVMVKYFVSGREEVGWRVGQLYAVNTMGAVVGTVATGFFLILLLGLREAAYLAGGVNLVIAGVVWVLGRRDRGTPVPDGPPGRLASPAAGAYGLSPGLARLALVAVGVSGFCALALEVLWTRALVYFLDNSTHAFTTMLSAFLVGIGLGSALIARFIDGRRGLLALLGAVEVLIGVSALLAVPVLAHTTPVMERLVGSTPDALLGWRWVGMRFATSLSVMLVPTLLMGMTVPLVARICTRDVVTVGNALGRVYFVNTVGGVVGSVAAGFVLIPLIGVQQSIGAIAALSVALGGVLLAADPVLRLRPRLRLAVASGASVMATGLVFLAFAGDGLVLTSYREKLDGVRVLAYDEGVGSTVKVFEDAMGDRFISIDGFPVAGTSFGLQDAQKSLGHIPMLLSDVPNPRVNLIGFGAGGASWGVLQYDAREVHVVELVPAVLEAASWFPEINHGVVDEPRFRAIREDGRNHLLVTDQRYDVISIDATSPKMAGNGSLYTLEFYRLLRARLTERGMAVQWLPFHLLSEAEMRMTVRTFHEVFPHTTVWLSPIRHHGLLVGTMEPLGLDLDEVATKLAREGVRAELEPMGVFGPMDVVSLFVMGEEGVARYAQGAPLNTDDHPYLEFTPAMSYFHTMKYVTENLYAFGMSRETVFPLLVNTGETDAERRALEERVETRLFASQRTLSGDIFYYLGMLEKAKGEWAMALLLDPDEKSWLHPCWGEVTGMDQERWWW